MWRPFEFERVAIDLIRVDIAAYSESCNTLPAGLRELAEAYRLTSEVKAGLLLKLPDGGIPSWFCLVIFPFGYRPRPNVPVGPIWTAWVNEQHLQRLL